MPVHESQMKVWARQSSGLSYTATSRVLKALHVLLRVEARRRYAKSPRTICQAILSILFGLWLGMLNKEEHKYCRFMFLYVVTTKSCLNTLLHRTK